MEIQKYYACSNYFKNETLGACVAWQVMVLYRDKLHMMILKCNCIIFLLAKNEWLYNIEKSSGKTKKIAKHKFSKKIIRGYTEGTRPSEVAGIILLPIMILSYMH